MNLEWKLPAIGSIQRTNLVLVAATSAVLAYCVSIDAAVGCLIGGAVVVANLYLLGLIGRVALAAASGGASTSIRLGTLAIPLKLFIMLGLIYLVFSRTHVDGLGFGFGILTQMIAIIIETARAQLNGRSLATSSGEDPCQNL